MGCKCTNSNYPVAGSNSAVMNNTIDKQKNIWNADDYHNHSMKDNASDMMKERSGSNPRDDIDDTAKHWWIKRD